MPERIAAWMGGLGATLWFVPSVLVVAGVGLALGLLALGNLVPEAAATTLVATNPESARSLLSTIASSTLTVAGVTFSIAILATVQAGMQYTPRLLREWLRDPIEQITLGALVGLYVYCLVVLRAVRADEAVPALAVFSSVPLAVLSMGLLVAYLHHTALSLHASTLIARLADETGEAIARVYPELLDGAPGWQPPRTLRTAGWTPVPALRSGHLNAVVWAELCEVADALGTRVVVVPDVGAFAIRGAPVAWVEPTTGGGRLEPRVARAIARALLVHPFRAVPHDPAFGLRLLSDIAVKAVSSSYNDPSTAITCVDHLGALIADLARRDLRPGWSRHDPARVVGCVPSFDELVVTAFDEIRLAARAWPSVLARVIRVLTVAAHAAKTPERRAVLARQVERVRAQAARSLHPDDLGGVLQEVEGFHH